MGKRSRSKREIRAVETPRAAVVTRSNDDNVAIAIAAAIAILVLVVFAQVRSHDFINFDDPDYVVTNPNVSTGLSVANVVWAFTHYHA